MNNMTITLQGITHHVMGVQFHDAKKTVSIQYMDDTAEPGHQVIIIQVSNKDFAKILWAKKGEEIILSQKGE